MTENADVDRISKAADELAEFFDSVQIFATRLENTEGGTVNISQGRGNWFTRYGQIRSWIIKEDESSRMDVRKHNE